MVEYEFCTLRISVRFRVEAPNCLERKRLEVVEDVLKRIITTVVNHLTVMTVDLLVEVRKTFTKPVTLEL